MTTDRRDFANPYIVVWPDGADAVLKSAWSLRVLYCPWAAAGALLGAAGDIGSLRAELAACGVADPAALVEGARDAGILVSERELAQLDAFFEDWTWGPVAAAHLFGYHTDAFVDPERELDGSRAADASVPALLCEGDEDAVALPPRVRADPLGEVVARRRSRRSFSDAPVELASVAACLGDALGITGQRTRDDGRTLPLTAAPSPGGLNTYDGLVLARRVDGLEDGTYRYLPARHALARKAGRHVPFDRLFGGQSWCARAACAIVLAADLRRPASRYDFPTTISAALIEAGARVELILLRAEAAGLSATTVGLTGVGAFARELAAQAGLPCATSMTPPVCAVLIGADRHTSV